MRQGGEPQGVQIVRQGEPTPYHFDFNPLYYLCLIHAPHAFDVAQDFIGDMPCGLC